DRPIERRESGDVHRPAGQTRLGAAQLRVTMRCFTWSEANLGSANAIRARAPIEHEGSGDVDYRLAAIKRAAFAERQFDGDGNSVGAAGAQAKAESIPGLRH